MAQSTTIINAKALVVSIGGNTISGSTASATLTVNMENSQFYTADGDFAAALTGKRQWSGTLNCYYSETAGEAYLLAATAFEAGTSTALVLGVAGVTAGDENLTGNVYFTSMPYSFDATSADPVMVAIPFIGNGTLTRADVV
jgi:hypothetical protein